MRIFRFFLFGCLFLVITLFSPKYIFAQNGTLEVSPAYIDVVLEAMDESKNIEFTYTNNGDTTLLLDIYPVDFKQKDSKGGVSFLGKDSAATYSYSLSSFLTLEANQLQLEPRESRKFVVQVQNRKDISPGGHYAAVVARQISSQGVETTVAPALSSLIFMRKTGGEQFNLSIQDVSWPKVPIAFNIPDQVTLEFQNAGNIHVIPYGTVELRDVFRRLVYKGVINTSSAIVMPESRRKIQSSLRSIDFMLPVSFNTLEIKGTDSLKKVTYVHQESFLFVHPYAGILVLVLAGLAIGTKKKGKKQA